MRVSSIWVAVLLLLVLDLSYGYEVGRCYCYDEMDEYLKTKESEMEKKMPANDYSYLGIQCVAHDKFAPCTCTDITRVGIDPFVLRDTWATDAVANNDSTRVAEAINNEFLSILINRPDLPLAAVVTKYIPGSSPGASFQVQINVKSRISNADNLIFNYVDEDIVNGVLPIIGQVYSPNPFFIIGCLDDPPYKPENGVRIWDGNKMAGFPVSYMCSLGSRFSDGSLVHTIECNAGTLRFDRLPEGLTCDMKHPCAMLPPTVENADFKPKEASLQEGSTVEYKCKKPDYIPSKTGKLISRCTSPIWTHPGFECVTKDTCIHAPPTISNTVNTWTNTVMPNGAVITYSCVHGYSPANGASLVVTSKCKNGMWTPIGGWRCEENSVN